MKETFWSRKGRTIRTIGNKEQKSFDSINLAKKESVKLQLSEGVLGAGHMVAIR